MIFLFRAANNCLTIIAWIDLLKSVSEVRQKSFAFVAKVFLKDGVMYR